MKPTLIVGSKLIGLTFAIVSLSSGYTHSERLIVVGSPSALNDQSSTFSITYRVEPSAELSLEECALSFLMILTLRSKRYPQSDLRRDIIQDMGRVVFENRATNTFKLQLSESLLPVPNDIAHLLTLAFSPVEYGYADEVWIQGIELPDRLRTKLNGPAFGTGSLRSMFQSSEKTPLLGLTLVCPDGQETDASNLLTEALRGGIDFVADDLFDIAGTDVTSALKRAEFVLSNIRSQRKSDLCPYFANLSSYTLMFPDTVDPLINAGVAGFIINPFTVGWDHSAAFRQYVDGRAAIIHSNMGSGIMSRRIASSSTGTKLETGMFEEVTSMLSRYTGADAVHAGTVGSECFDKEWTAPIHILRTPMGSMNASFCVAEGDITPVNYIANLRVQGTDMLIEANSALYGHPSGPRAGAKAFQEAIGLIDPDDNSSEEELLEMLHRKGSSVLKEAIHAFETDKK